MFRRAHQLILMCSTCVMWISTHICLFASLVSYKISINKFMAQWLITCTFNENVKIIHGHSHSTTNKMHLLSQIIYSCKTLYVFRTVFPSIIRSSKLHTQQRYMSNSCCYQGWDSISSPIAAGRVQLKRDGTRWRMGGEVKGKLANEVGSQYPSHYLGTWCIQHYFR